MVAGGLAGVPADLSGVGHFGLCRRPDFCRPPAPDADGYVRGKLASPDPGPGGPKVAGQHFVTGADVSARWWSAFKSLPLNELVRQSVDRNPNLQAAEAAIKVARYNALAQRGLYFPQISGNSNGADYLIANPGQVPPIPTIGTAVPIHARDQSAYSELHAGHLGRQLPGSRKP